MDVSVVITCWNGRSLLEKNLPLVIKAADDPCNKVKEIMVVDDGSTDESASFLKKRFPQIKVVVHDKNQGYSATCNTGVDLAANELVAILNLDVVPSNDFLKEALPHFEDQEVFAVSFNEGKFGPGKLVWKKGFLEIEGNSDIPKSFVLTDWPSGGSSIFRKSYWEKLGGMDKIFIPFYFEDIDLGVRARKAGFKCIWEPGARVEHEHEATINSDSFKQRYIDSIKQRNQLLLIWKNINSPKLFLSHLFHLKIRCFTHPGYLRIVFLALKRKLTK